MLEMSAPAERAGIRAVIGMGASPGLVNLLAVVAMRELDDVHRVVTGWNGEGASPEPGSGTAAIEHGIAQATGTIPVVREGRERSERPLRRVALDYPGLGRRRARTFGHPEPVTLHRTFDVAESVNVTHGRLRFVAPLLAIAWLCHRGLLSTRRAVGAIDWAERRMPSPSLGALASNRRLPPLFARGRRRAKRSPCGGWRRDDGAAGTEHGSSHRSAPGGCRGLSTQRQSNAPRRPPARVRVRPARVLRCACPPLPWHGHRPTGAPREQIMGARGVGRPTALASTLPGAGFSPIAPDPPRVTGLGVRQCSYGPSSAAGTTPIPSGRL